MSAEEASEIHGTFKTVYKDELGIHFKKFGNGICLNTTPLDDIKNDLAPKMNDEYICCATHEQYAYPEYFAYQPQTKEKLMNVCEVVTQNDYEYFLSTSALKCEKIPM